jgi:hypothetical protein
MRRLRCQTLNFATAVSGLLFLATCVLWMRSFRITDSVSGRGYRGAAEGVAGLSYHSLALRPSAFLASASDSTHATIRWKVSSVRKRT